MNRQYVHGNWSDEKKDPRWQKMRLLVMNRDNWKCCACGDSTTTLNVHHIVYGSHPWSVDFSDLQTLCERCHKDLGPHPKGGPFYAFQKEPSMITVDDCDNDFLMVGYRHCPLCGCRETSCHSACVVFDCGCPSPDLPEWCSGRFNGQRSTDDGYAAYAFSIDRNHTEE